MKMTKWTGGIQIIEEAWLHVQRECNRFIYEFSAKLRAQKAFYSAKIKREGFSIAGPSRILVASTSYFRVNNVVLPMRAACQLTPHIRQQNDTLSLPSALSNGASSKAATFNPFTMATKSEV
jgi:hypothetical protein